MTEDTATMYDQENDEVEQATQDGNVSVSDLLQERKELDERIAQIKKEELEGAMLRILDLMDTYDIQPSDIAKRLPKKKAKAVGSDGRAKVAPKYQCPDTGATWTGRGKSPRWYDPNTAILL